MYKVLKEATSDEEDGNDQRSDSNTPSSSSPLGHRVRERCYDCRYVFLCLMLIVSIAAAVVVTKQTKALSSADSLTESEVNNNNGEDDIYSPDEEEDDVSSSIGSPQTPVELERRCPSWSKSFAEQYYDTCSPWLDRFATWEQKLSSKSKEAAYWCENDADCRGWGDRLGGVLNAFYKSILNNLQFHIYHDDGIHGLFTPCVFQTKRANWAAARRTTKPKSDACVYTSATTCYRWLDTNSCSGSGFVSKNTDRTCMPGAICTDLIDKTNHNVHAANAIGCALRAILEPSKRLFQDETFPFRVGREKPKDMSLFEIQQVMSDYFVISIHFRLGDGMAFYNKAGEITMESEKFSRPFRCAQTLESYLARVKGGMAGGDDLRVNGKPVMWFLASDSVKIKHAAQQSFGDRLMTLDIRPQHVAINVRNSNVLMNTIAEWYILGLGDELIVNKIGMNHNDFYHGRVSAFPKTSWAYHLKHWVYDAGKCTRSSLPFEGTWEDLKQKVCSTQSNVFKNQAMDQYHLKPLRDAGVDFPQAYVLNGKVVITEEKEQMDG